MDFWHILVIFDIMNAVISTCCSLLIFRIKLKSYVCFYLLKKSYHLQTNNFIFNITEVLQNNSSK